jgi:hypothetical protein
MDDRRATRGPRSADRADGGVSAWTGCGIAGPRRRSYAQGFAGTFELKRTDDGYVWETPAGPGAVMRFTATVKGDTWREVGEYIAADWPLGTPIAPASSTP